MGISHSRLTPKKWPQSETTEINSLIQPGAFSPFYDGPVQSELNKSSRHINIRFHALRTKADFEADLLTKPLPTQLYEQLCRDKATTRLNRIEIKYLWTKKTNILLFIA
jgi:hypothetical protein